MSRTPLYDSLKLYSEKSGGYFRIPGHRFERGIPEDFRSYAGDNIFKLDVTETPMSDDLHNPKTVIAESQRLTAEAFGSAQSFYLVNGTTCGNESMIIAAAGESEKILIPRNAHKSVLAGLIISGAQPVYMPVDYLPTLGLSGVLKTATAAGLLKQHPDAKAVFAVSPSYHGLCSDLAAFGTISHAAGIPLLVDEAHGAHLYFSSSLPAGALELGADACAQSMHKTAGALTQASLLHLSEQALSKGRIDSGRIDSALRMTMSTSPSYLLMCSLELARNDLEVHGREYWSRTIESAEELRRIISKIPGFKCPGTADLRSEGIIDADPTRLIINCDESKLSGWDLKSLLWKNYCIDVEMADSRNILLILTYGNTDSDYKNLVLALNKIAATANQAVIAVGESKLMNEKPPAIPEMKLTPRKAYFAKKKTIPWNEMKGAIIAEPLAPYPPGIPVIYPGEFVTEEIFEYLNEVKNRKRHLHGPSDKSLETVKICETA